MSNTRKEAFVRVLCSLYDQFYDDAFDVETYSAEVMSALFEGSGDFPESRRCFELIEFGSDTANIDADSLQYGFKLKGQPYTYLSTLLSCLERIPVPEHVSVQDYFPDMTQEEWEAAMFMCSRTLSAFDRIKPKNPGNSIQQS